MISKLIAEGP